ncbi:hypothetical protein FVEN_g8116 [Fusarium venenatum]|nr:hypothetical protein FVEN_g8116 [Fusarium venenatum]
MSLLADLPTTQPDEAFALVADFKADTNEQKVDLCPGFYRDDKAKPWVLPSVAQGKERIHGDSSLDHEHLPLAGHPGLLLGSQKLLFGTTRDLKRVSSIQTVSVRHRVDFEAMTETLRKNARAGDVIILHACAHNPTGADLTSEQWKTVAEICKKSSLFPVFDIAYQGFASGDLDQDASAINHFYDRSDLEFAVAQSFSKNFGLYGERIGVLHVVALDMETAAKLTPLLTRLSRAEITSCPSYGARIVAEILSGPNLYEQWLRDLVTMSERMKSMRRSLYQGLKRREVKGSWEHLLTDIGMFSMTGLTRAQVDKLRTDHHVYLLPSGRLSVTGLTSGNVDYVAEALLTVLGKN